eukprot:3931937-Rhodomonas_salina.1
MCDVHTDMCWACASWIAKRAAKVRCASGKERDLGLCAVEVCEVLDEQLFQLPSHALAQYRDGGWVDRRHAIAVGWICDRRHVIGVGVE